MSTMLRSLQNLEESDKHPDVRSSWDERALGVILPSPKQQWLAPTLSKGDIEQFFRVLHYQDIRQAIISERLHLQHLKATQVQNLADDSVSPGGQYSPFLSVLRGEDPRQVHDPEKLRMAEIEYHAGWLTYLNTTRKYVERDILEKNVSDAPTVHDILYNYIEYVETVMHLRGQKWRALNHIRGLSRAKNDFDAKYAEHLVGCKIDIPDSIEYTNQFYRKGYLCARRAFARHRSSVGMVSTGNEYDSRYDWAVLGGTLNSGLSHLPESTKPHRLTDLQEVISSCMDTSRR